MFMDQLCTVIKPKALKKGDTIGIFTPSWPAHLILRNKYQHALSQIKKLGFNYTQGSLTKSEISGGYRTDSPEKRAQEFMELIRDDKVSCLIATIGGWNSSSLIPYLDFDEIRESRKIICGYSDITSLQLAILKYSNLSTLYGPSIVPIFGAYPEIFPFAWKSFFNLASGGMTEAVLSPPEEYSTEFIDATKTDWQERERKRDFQKNEGWRILNEGSASGRLIVVNLETLLANAGTSSFPNLENTILVLEEESARFSIQERSFTQLSRMGVFDQISALVISKPFSYYPEGSKSTYEELIMELVGKRAYPIISNFDCGHTFPSLSLPIGTLASISASKNEIRFTLDESFVN